MSLARHLATFPFFFSGKGSNIHSSSASEIEWAGLESARATTSDRCCASIGHRIQICCLQNFTNLCEATSGGFRNSERGVQPLAREARPQICPLSVTLEVQTEYLEATLGLVKCLEISKELIRECVTCLVVVAACHSCIII